MDDAYWGPLESWALLVLRMLNKSATDTEIYLLLSTYSSIRSTSRPTCTSVLWSRRGFALDGSTQLGYVQVPVTAFHTIVSNLKLKPGDLLTRLLIFFFVIIVGFVGTHKQRHCGSELHRERRPSPWRRRSSLAGRWG
jgi:hypothetical protein